MRIPQNRRYGITQRAAPPIDPTEQHRILRSGAAARPVDIHHIDPGFLTGLPGRTFALGKVEEIGRVRRFEGVLERGKVTPILDGGQVDDANMTASIPVAIAERAPVGKRSGQRDLAQGRNGASISGFVHVHRRGERQKETGVERVAAEFHKVNPVAQRREGYGDVRYMEGRETLARGSRHEDTPLVGTLGPIETGKVEMRDISNMSWSVFPHKDPLPPQTMSSEFSCPNSLRM